MPYSIGEFARLCGINATTLRAWQRRYGLAKRLDDLGEATLGETSPLAALEAEGEKLLLPGGAWLALSDGADLVLAPS